MKSISYIAGYTFGTAKSLVSRIPTPDVDKIKADFKQAVTDQSTPKPDTTEQDLMALFDAISQDPDFQAYLAKHK